MSKMKEFIINSFFVWFFFKALNNFPYSTPFSLFMWVMIKYLFIIYFYHITNIILLVIRLRFIAV